jgi:hypothetical protein
MRSLVHRLVGAPKFRDGIVPEADAKGKSLITPHFLSW